MIKRVFTNWWVLSIGAFLLLGLLLIVGLPIFVGFLRPLLVKIAIGITLLLLWGLWFFLRRRKAKQGEKELEEELIEIDLAGDEAAATQSRMKEMLGQLRKASGKSRNYLYSQPWYVIIGPPGAGKTTALLNSGLRFPYAEGTLDGVSGTRDLDFMLADEAVLVDTAGRYTTQDSDAEVDKSGWRSLLKLLRKHRSLEPINGIFVALPVDELQRGELKNIDYHAGIVRRRLQEIRSELETELPVYLLLTKSDKLAGFVEYFADLDVEGRRAVFGHTFDWKTKQLTSENISTAFDEVTNSIAQRHPKRMQEENDIKRRGLILGFPSQLHSLRAPLHRFIEGAFVEGAQIGGRLRGFYFTSGLQDGNALDRILDSVSSSYSGERQMVQQNGRAYFLNKLLQNVVFPESGLQVSDAKLVRKNKAKLVTILSGIGISALALSVAWVVSFRNNNQFLKQTQEAALVAADEINFSRVDLAQVGESDVPLEQLLPLLDQLREMPEGYAARLESKPPLSKRFGLYQKGQSRQNAEIYQNGLRRTLMPRIILRLEDQIRRNMNDPVALYEPLKVYLMLGGAAPEGQLDREAIRNYVERDYATNIYSGSEMRPVRDALSRHLKALVEDPNIQAGWAGRKAPLDGDLVFDARSSVAQLSLAQRAYAIMKEASANLEGDWRMDAILQRGDVLAFANSDEILEQTVPYFFTREGFNKSYAIKLATVEKSLRRELWVVGEDDSNASIEREMGNLRAGVSNSYATDYIAHWERIIGQLQPGDYFNDPKAYRAFVRAPSPLKKVLVEVRDNTSFAGGGLAKAGEMAMDRATRRSRVIRAASNISGASGGRGMSADIQVENYFNDINDWTGRDEEPAALDEFVTLVRNSFKQVLVSQNSNGAINSSARLAEALAPIEQAAFEVPDLVSGFVNQVARGGNKAQNNIIKSDIQNNYQQNVLQFCKNAVQSRYPFELSSSQEAGLREVRAAFGEGGKMTLFVNEQLTPYIQQNAGKWRWATNNQVTRDFGLSSIDNFQKSYELQDAIANGLPLEIELVELGANVSRVELSTSGATLKYSAENFDPQSITWQLGAGVVRSSELVTYSRDGSGRDAMLWDLKTSGDWSLFRVFDKARIRNSGRGSVTAQFRSGEDRIVLKVSFPEKQNPFSGGGLWSVKCPSKL